jgi:hypothetical protein
VLFGVGLVRFGVATHVIAAVGLMGVRSDAAVVGAGS